jgi:ornithine cyclodeaminase/alanine dehydrogenase-like protein (mu-crystallin family)
MECRFVDAETLRAYVRFEDLIEPMERAFQQSTAGDIHNGLIVMFPGATHSLGDVYVKTGAAPSHDVYVVKVSPWFRVNAEQGEPQGGFVAAFDSRTGHTLAILTDEHYLSDIRTAAAGSVAARWLAPPTIRTVGVLGAGVQARLQSLALYRERPFDQIMIWARNASRALRLRSRLAVDLPLVDVRVSDDLEQTVRAADVLITATAAREPLVRGPWLHPGQHITAVGADDPYKCELAVDALQRSRVFVDARDGAIANGDIHRAIQRDGYSIDQVAGELGEVIAGDRPGRTADSDITVAKLIGIGAQDLAAVEVALIRLGCHPSVAGNENQVDS